MKNKKNFILILVLLLIIFCLSFAFYRSKNEKTINNVISCDLNKSYNALYSFSSSSGPKIDYPCNCPDNSYLMTISSYSGMSVVLGNGGNKTIEYQCVKDFKVCPINYKLTSYSDPNTDGYLGRFTCTKN